MLKNYLNKNINKTELEFINSSIEFINSIDEFIKINNKDKNKFKNIFNHSC